MSDLKKFVRIKELIDNAESALKVAKQLLTDSMGLQEGEAIEAGVYKEKAVKETNEIGATGKIIEGVFDGQNMVDKKGTVYPVPANYASKSKLVPGDILKLTVTEEGKFLYKQIGPVERKTIVGPLVYNDGRYQILTDSKAYNVLLASVTYFRAEVGDEVTLIIPMNENSDWGAIEAVLPKFGEAIEEEKEEGEKEEKVKKTKKVTKKSKKDVDLEVELDI